MAEVSLALSYPELFRGAHIGMMRTTPHPQSAAPQGGGKGKRRPTRRSRKSGQQRNHAADWGWDRSHSPPGRLGRVLLLPRVSAWNIVPCLAHALARGLAGMAGKDTKVLALAPGGLLPRWCQGRGRAASTRSSCREVCN